MFESKQSIKEPGFSVTCFKKLMTVDREEMEGYRSIRNLVSEYYNRRAQEPKPISIAVFGPPGSGKSFGVKQIAGSIQGLQAETITYNCSQFNAPDELALAFIKSRDISLQGKLPIIFLTNSIATFKESWDGLSIS
jgi:predicted ATPase